MTQQYYTEKLLPRYAKAIHEARVYYGEDAILQEDNDPSHGTRSTNNVAKKYKDANWIPTLVHPAQSPDLNPIEAVWAILKQRLRKRSWQNIDELKEMLQEIWRGISQDEIRARIAEMPRRCKLLVQNGGKAIRSDKW